jgi:hypothetical protein
VHLYWCADCKTPGCKQRQILKDVEFAPEASDDLTISLNFPAKFELATSLPNRMRRNPPPCTVSGRVVSAADSIRRFSPYGALG